MKHVITSKYRLLSGVCDDHTRYHYSWPYTALHASVLYRHMMREQVICNSLTVSTKQNMSRLPRHRPRLNSTCTVHQVSFFLSKTLFLPLFRAFSAIFLRRFSYLVSHMSYHVSITCLHFCIRPSVVTKGSSMAKFMSWWRGCMLHHTCPGLHVDCCRKSSFRNGEEPQKSEKVFL